MIRALAKDRRCFLAVLALLAACSSTSKQDEARSAEFARVWSLYRANSPEWPVERDRWLARGETERGILIESLLIDMLQTKIITDPGGKLLGATIVGAHAGELIAEYVLALAKGMNAKALTNVIHAYPTLAQINRRVADQRLKEGLTPASRAWIQRIFGLRGARQ